MAAEHARALYPYARRHASWPTCNCWRATSAASLWTATHSQHTAGFCTKYDAATLDPTYESLPLSLFEPRLQRLFAQPRQSLYKAAMEQASPT